MFSYLKYTSKLVGALALASFCFLQFVLGQTLEIVVESGSLAMRVKDEAVKTQLEKQELMPSAVVQVFLKNPKEVKSQPAILGDFSFANGKIRFTPLLSFQFNNTYYIVYQDNEVYPILIPETDFIQPEVLAIYPSADTLPANQLKFYLHFNAPMSQGKAYEHVKLVKNGIDTLTFPFVRLEPELWNREKTRLTLWLDPGRVKRDLNPNRELGAPLEIGNHYQLIVASAWESQQGQALQANFIKEFFVGFEDRKKPKVEDWKIEVPEKNTKNPLLIDFGEPMDQALANRVIEIMDENKEILSGTISFQKEEQICLFMPDKSWKSGDYQIRVGAELEDLAGNNLNRLFDVDLKKGASQVADERFYWLSFQVKR